MSLELGKGALEGGSENRAYQLIVISATSLVHSHNEADETSPLSLILSGTLQGTRYPMSLPAGQGMGRGKGEKGVIIHYYRGHVL